MKKEKEKTQIKLPLIKKEALHAADWIKGQLDIYQPKEESEKLRGVGFWLQSSKK